PSRDPTAGQNPPGAVSINYYLKAAPKADPSIKIVDAEGKTGRTIRGTRNAGINRVWWDLRAEQSKEIRLRTSPGCAPEVRLNAGSWPPLPESGRMPSLVPPGTYAVRLWAVGRESTDPLTEVADPNAIAIDEDIQ